MTASYESAIEELSSAGTKKFETAKRLLRASEERPAALYPYFGTFRLLLRSDNNIIRWTAIRIIANLAAVDARRRIPRVLDEYLAAIPGPTLITAANTIAGAAKIANAQSRLAPKVIDAILRVERARYQTAECRNVAIGRAIAALGTMPPEARRSRKVVSFVERQRRNSRASTRKKAESFLKGLGNAARDPTSMRAATPRPARRG